jgi:hypothetical protein
MTISDLLKNAALQLNSTNIEAVRALIFNGVLVIAD